MMLRGGAGVAAVIVLAAHLVAGVAALLLLPHGFSVNHGRFWSNTVIPGTCVVATAGGLISYVFSRTPPLVPGALVAAIAGGWVAAGIGCAVLFPISMPLSRSLPFPVAGLALMFVARMGNKRTALMVASLLFGAAVGAFVVAAQRAPDPSTHPSGGELAAVGGDAPSSSEVVSGEIPVTCGTGKIRLQPLLTFHSRSPDRAWVVLADANQHGSRRSFKRHESRPSGFLASYVDDGESTLVATRDRDALDVEALSKLDAAVYSHLNAWTTLRVEFDATVSFGPVGELRFPVEPHDYPVGRPLQLAYVDSHGAFRVVRASDGEKGPFSELARGRLARDEPLALEIRRRDRELDGCRFVFADWAAQVSTEPSPTAGWGVTQGTIQFFSSGLEGIVLITLADTGVGRGFDSVGHAAGTYRNRVRVEPLRDR